jgi:hypothetical protein
MDVLTRLIAREDFIRLNTSLQGPNATISQLFDKVSGFIKQMTLWKSLCESYSIKMFVNMSEHLQENDCEFKEIKPQVLTHITSLESNFWIPDLTLSQHEQI